MANPENIKEYQFDKIAASKQREIAKKGAAASAEVRRKKKTRRELLQTFLDGTYTVTDKKTGKAATFSGDELIDKDIAAILGNPNHKHFMKMFELMFGDKYEAEIEKIQADTKFTEARTAQMSGENKDIEDLTDLYNLFDDKD